MRTRDNERYVKVCPKCGSIKIQVDKRSFWWFLHITSPKHYCSNCNFSSFIFPEVRINELEQLRKEFS